MASSTAKACLCHGGRGHLQGGEHQSQLSMLNIRIHQSFNHIDLSSQIPDPGQAATNQQEKTCTRSTRHG